MLHEFALEPALLNTWAQFQFFMAQFGVEHGRLISRYPKRWKRLVYDALQDCGEVERKRIEESLTRIDNRLIKRAGVWEPASNWLVNAEQEHLRTPFRAIVAADNPRINPTVLAVDDLDATAPHERWAVPRTVIIPRTPEGLAAAIAPLVRIARTVVIVDRYFGPENSRHRRPLERILRKIAAYVGNDQWPSIEIHLGDNSESQFFRQQCNEHITPMLDRSDL